MDARRMWFSGKKHMDQGNRGWKFQGVAITYCEASQKILLGDSSSTKGSTVDLSLTWSSRAPPQPGRPKPAPPACIVSRYMVTYLLLETSGTSSRAAELPHIERESSRLQNQRSIVLSKQPGSSPMVQQQHLVLQHRLF